MTKKYIKKPIPVEAIQFTRQTFPELMDWLAEGDARWTAEHRYDEQPVLIIHTLEGDMETKTGDYIIKGVRGEFYPCAREIFEETYEPAEGDQ